MNIDITGDRALQYWFTPLQFVVDGVSRECYYCTLENGGGWFWLRTNAEDALVHDTHYIDINFVVDDEYTFDELYRRVCAGEDVADLGKFCLMRRFTHAEEVKHGLRHLAPSAQSKK